MFMLRVLDWIGVVGKSDKAKAALGHRDIIKAMLKPDAAPLRMMDKIFLHAGGFKPMLRRTKE
jgi:hypothetical protein